MPEDVARCVEDAKTTVDRAALELAEAEHKRATSALTHQREELLSATSDMEREKADLQNTLKERELRLITLQGHQRSTDAALSSANDKHTTFIKGLLPAAPQLVAKSAA